MITPAKVATRTLAAAGLQFCTAGDPTKYYYLKKASPAPTPKAATVDADANPRYFIQRRFADAPAGTGIGAAAIFQEQNW